MALERLTRKRRARATPDTPDASDAPTPPPAPAISDDVASVLEAQKKKTVRFGFARSGKPLADRFAFLRAESPVPIYIGIACVLVGFAVIGVAWGEVAGKLNVALQLPYIVSGGLTGLGLIMVGITIVSISAKRRDAAERARQLDQLGAIMKELRDELRGDQNDR